MFHFSRKIDSDYLNIIYGNDEEIVKTMMMIFLNDSLPSWQGTKGAIQSRDYESAKKEVHRIKPSFTMVGLKDFHEPVQLLEALLKAPNDPKQIADLYQLIDDELTVVLPLIDEFMNR